MTPTTQQPLLGCCMAARGGGVAADTQLCQLGFAPEHEWTVANSLYLLLTPQRSKASCATLRASSGFMRHTPSC